MSIFMRSPFRYAIEKKNPLKQGLKPPVGNPVADVMFIEKKNPLKQGLKHAFVY